MSPALDASLPIARKSFAQLSRDTSVRAIVAAWRRLVHAPTARSGRKTPPARTLVACSGGADSVALLLALSTATDNLVVGHITHDLRPPAQARADRDFVHDLASQLQLPFAEGVAHVRSVAADPTKSRNREARARTARYHALAQLAEQHQCPFIAIGHHADDQLETVLMALVRGAGPRGLSGIALSRTVGATSRRPRTRLIRPMLAASVFGHAITRDVAEDLCKRAGIDWHEDSTNADTTLLRAALRHRVLPIINELRPRASAHAAASASIFRDAHALITREARAILECANRTESPASFTWRADARKALQVALTSVLFELLRLAHVRLVGRRHLDTLCRRALAPVIRAITDSSTERRSFSLAAVQIDVSTREVTIRPRTRAQKATP